MRCTNAADAALRRPAHQRADEGHARRRTSCTPRSPRTARSRREPLRRAPAGLPLLSRRRRPRASTARPARNAAAHVLARGAGDARAPRRRRQERRVQAHAAAAGSCGSGEEIAQLEPSEDPLKPVCHRPRGRAPRRAGQGEGAGAARHVAGARAIAERLKPLVEIGKAEDIPGLARGIAFRLARELRRAAARDGRRRDQGSSIRRRALSCASTACASARSTSISRPLLKPAAAELALTLVVAEERRHEHGLDCSMRCPSCRGRADLAGAPTRALPRRSIAPAAITCAGRARCASTCSSGWPISSGRCSRGARAPRIPCRRRRARPATAASRPRPR